MQLDQTHVKIRQRGPAEVADLALLVFHRYGSSLLWVWALGALPFMLVNGLILGWIPWEASYDDLMDDEIFQEQFRYVWLSSALVYLQAPWACSMMTMWLGRAVFQQRPTPREVLSDFRETFWGSLLVLGAFRGPILAMLLVTSNWWQPLAIGREVVCMMLIVFLIGLLRLARPFVPEIILLERCPLRKAPSEGLVAGKRSQFLHSPAAAEISSRSMLCAALAIGSTLVLTGAFVFVRTHLANRVGWGLDVSLVLFPLALWLTAGVCTVLRFLNYLDTRIRLEGWEVELALRAEADRWLVENQAPTTR